jgi:Kef-type K+ transport system membrane component KefB
MGKPFRALTILGLILITLIPEVLAAGNSAHGDPIAPVLLALIAILGTAKIGSEIFERLSLPSVLGELLGGLILGNLVLLNPAWTFFEPLRTAVVQEHWAVVIDSLARLGVLILLFEVGLESTVQSMRKVGAPAILVASLGVIAPFLLGFATSWLFIRELPPGLASIANGGINLFYVHLFIGAVLSATSVGITARVFKDLNKLQTREAQIILGAAVVDDIMGLILLALVSGVVTAAKNGQPLEVIAIIRLIGAALLFLGLSLVLGVLLIPRVMKQLARLRTAGIMLISSLLFAFVMADLAIAAGLAAIVGAFAAGLLLEDVHFRGFREEIHLEQLIRPIATFLVPVFFVLMGIQVRLEMLVNWPVLGLAAGLTIAAVLGKQICGLGVMGKGLDRLTVGVGMIPRGEVGLIFASIGKELEVIDDATFSAVIIMVMVTTLITPPLLQWTLARHAKAR